MKSNLKAARALREYCKSKNMDQNVESSYDAEKLNNLLSHFYIDARKECGEKYKVSSLENIRFSLNRFFQEKNPGIDIIKDKVFQEANLSFKAAITELKREGKGDVKHYPVINDTHLHQIYNSEHLNPRTPERLQNKVQFDVRFYFARRGAENMHAMSKKTFTVQKDPKTNKEFVVKVEDELVKNHRAGDKESYSGIMPENPSSPLCPVKSFKLYFSKLHPDCDRLWQRPKNSFLEEDRSWYYNVPVGQKTLSGFMTKISKLVNLPTNYTNHCIRATGATLLSRTGYNNAQIMAITGHKSVSSLAIYQRVNEAEKINMGDTLSKFVHGSNSCDITKETPSSVVQQKDIPSSSSSNFSRPLNINYSSLCQPLPISNSMVNNHSLDVDTCDDFAAINIEDFDVYLNETHDIVSRPQQQRQPVFHNCVISNLTINYYNQNKTNI